MEGRTDEQILHILLCPDREIPLEECTERTDCRCRSECGRTGRDSSGGDKTGKTFCLHPCHEDHPQLWIGAVSEKSAGQRANDLSVKALPEGGFPDDRQLNTELK